VAYTWGRTQIGPGDEIVLTELEHHSNIVPWQMLAQERGAKLRYVEVGEDGKLDLEQYAELLNQRTRLVTLNHVSNALGTINPIVEIARLAHQRGALVLVDGAQGVPHLPVDVTALGADFLAFSSHKMLGPTGIGVLWGRRDLLESIPPFLGGGEMIHEVDRDRSTYNVLPWKFEAGTPNIADTIAFGAAIDYLQAVGMEAVRAHELELTAYALGQLRRQSDVKIYGPADPVERSGVISFSVGDIHPHDVGAVLDAEGVAVRVGHHCCQPLMRKLGISGTARASFYLYNTLEEVDALVRALGGVRQFFGVSLLSEPAYRR
jgi:cysteine desulfurase/selenocysteine lyase